jgi:nicotinamide-nucleotide amidase
MVSDRELLGLAERVGAALTARGWHLATAESCTAGWIAKVLTDVAGSSAWFDGGYVVYSDAAKRRDLGVRADTLAAHGAVSAATAREMGEGALQRTGADLVVAVTGIAGPGGAVPGKPVGTVWFAVSVRGEDRVESAVCAQLFDGDREAVRRAAVRFALELVQRAAAHTV